MRLPEGYKKTIAEVFFFTLEKREKERPAPAWTPAFTETVSVYIQEVIARGSS
jgi:hypothetical protein